MFLLSRAPWTNLYWIIKYLQQSILYSWISFEIILQTLNIFVRYLLYSIFLLAIIYNFLSPESTNLETISLFIKNFTFLPRFNRAS